MVVVVQKTRPVGPLCSHLGNHSAVVEEAARSSILPACDREERELSCVGLANVNQITILTCMYECTFFNRVTFLLFLFFFPSPNFVPFSPSLLHTPILSALHEKWLHLLHPLLL